MTTQQPVKEIRYDRETRDFAMYLDGELVGFERTHHAAEVALDQLVYDRLAHDAPSPVEAAVEAALEAAAEENAGYARAAEAAGVKADVTFFRRQTTAYTNALIEYHHGVRPERLASGAYLLPSRRSGEAPHIVRKDGDWVCTCKAGSSMHWPIALAIGIERGYELLEHGLVGENGGDDGAPVLAADPDDPDAPRGVDDTVGDEELPDDGPTEYHVGTYTRAQLLESMLARSAAAIAALRSRAQAVMAERVDLTPMEPAGTFLDEPTAELRAMTLELRDRIVAARAARRAA